MKACYRKSDGLYCDNERSFAKYPGDTDFIKSKNVMGRLGGKETDYIIIETEEPKPWLKRYQDGKLVDDTEKMEAITAEQTAKQQEQESRNALIQKIKTKTATLEEIQEYLAIGLKE